MSIDKYGHGFAQVPIAMMQENHSVLKVWLGLWLKSNYRSKKAVCTMKELVEVTELTDRTIRPSLRRLEDLGYITRAVVHDDVHGGALGVNYNLRLDVGVDDGNQSSTPRSMFPGTPPETEQPALPSISQRKTTESPAWAVKLANAIRKHVADTHNLNTTDKQRDRWAKELDALTRTTVLAKKPTASEVERVILWGLQDKQPGDGWPGWYMNIRSAPDPRKYAKIEAGFQRAANAKQQDEVHADADLN